MIMSYQMLEKKGFSNANNCCSNHNC